MCIYQKGVTPLMLATTNGNLDIMKQLVAAHCNVNAANKASVTIPLVAWAWVVTGVMLRAVGSNCPARRCVL
jgi:hypothetical protein